MTQTYRTGSFRKILPPHHSSSSSEKIDTLCLLVQRIVEENRNLKNEISIVVDQCDKQKEAKEAIKTLNAAYKKQVGGLCFVEGRNSMLRLTW